MDLPFLGYKKAMLICFRGWQQRGLRDRKKDRRKKRKGFLFVKEFSRKLGKGGRKAFVCFGGIGEEKGRSTILVK